MSYELKDYLNSINFTKEYLMSEEDPTWEKKYPPFIINKCLSGFIDTIMYGALFFLVINYPPYSE